MKKMNVICIDDEPLVLEQIIYLCEQIALVSHAVGFTNTDQALTYMEDYQPIDAVLLDINMPEVNGLVLAAQIRARWPKTALIFVTGYSEFALDAFKLHSFGYLLKPVFQEELEEVLNFIADLKPEKSTPSVFIQTFGNFDIFVQGRAVSFKRAKSKEILAYLVDKRGTGVSRPELAAVLWEEGLYDHARQKQLDVYIRSLTETLAELGIDDIIEKKRGVLRVLPEKISCDLYDFLNGDIHAINTYRGEYMNAYSWAEIRKALL